MDHPGAERVHGVVAGDGRRHARDGRKPVTIVGEGRRKHTFVSERDVASFGVAAVTHPAARNGTFPSVDPRHSPGAMSPRSTSGYWGTP